MKWKRLLVIVAVTFQVGAVASMVASREWLLATGKPYLFQTAPVDPRDIFRGDYVRLDYLFSYVNTSRLEEVGRESGLRKGQKVYLSLEQDSNGVSSGRQLYLSPPQGAFLRGYVLSDWPSRYYRWAKAEERGKELASAWPVQVKYGIERYYVQQGQGLEMEAMRGQRNDFQVPMLIDAVVSDSGEAAIRSYAWANIAIKTEIARSPERDVEDDQASAVIHLTLKNRSDKALHLPLKADNCSFVLTTARYAPADAVAFTEKRHCESAAPQPLTLLPGESHTLVFDLNQPYWQIMHKEKLLPLGKLPWEYRYRIHYRGEPIDGLRASIVSSAFHGRGNLD